MNMLSVVICCISVALFTACDKHSESGPISDGPSVLVSVKAAKPEEEHDHHEDHEESKDHGEESKSSHRETTAHVHGAASMNLILENTQLNITMSIPGMDAVGFEHPAINADDQAILQKTLGHLQKPDVLFLLPKSAGCQLVNGTVETALLDKNARSGTHADVGINYQWTCNRPGELKQLSVQLFSYTVNLQKIHANWVSQDKQGAAELTKESAVLFIQ